MTTYLERLEDHFRRLAKQRAQLYQLWLNVPFWEGPMPEDVRTQREQIRELLRGLEADETRCRRLMEAARAAEDRRTALGDLISRHRGPGPS